MQIEMRHREHDDPHRVADHVLVFTCCRCGALFDIPRSSKLTGYTPDVVLYRAECPSCYLTYTVRLTRDVDGR